MDLQYGVQTPSGFVNLHTNDDGLLIENIYKKLEEIKLLGDSQWTWILVRVRGEHD